MKEQLCSRHGLCVVVTVVLVLPSVSKVTNLYKQSHVYTSMEHITVDSSRMNLQ